MAIKHFHTLEDFLFLRKRTDLEFNPNLSATLSGQTVLLNCRKSPRTLTSEVVFEVVAVGRKSVARPSWDYASLLTEGDIARRLRRTPVFPVCKPHKLYQIISNAFNVESSKINDETSPENLEEWDSFNFYVLLDELENEFNVKFDLDETLEIKKVGDFKEILKKHGIDGWKWNYII